MLRMCTLSEQIAVRYMSDPEERPSSSSSVASGETPTTSPKHNNTGAIVGGLLGGLAILAAGVSLFFLSRRRRVQQQQSNARVPPRFVVALDNRSAETLDEKAPIPAESPTTDLAPFKAVSATKLT